MLRKKDLINNKYFTKWEDCVYYCSSDFDYVIVFESNGPVLRTFCEVNGVGDIVKDLTSLEDLNETIEYLNI